MILDRPSSVDDTIGALLGDPAIARLITAHRVMEPQPPRYAPWPDGLDPRLVNALRGRGFEALYTHQAAAIESVRAGRNVCVVSMWKLEISSTYASACEPSRSSSAGGPKFPPAGARKPHV